MRWIRNCSFVLLATTMGLGLLSCGGAGSSRPGGMEAGDLGVFIVDALPDRSITSVELDIAAIEANLGGYWVRVGMKESSFDLLELVDEPLLVAGAGVSPGQYSQFRIRLNHVRVEDADGLHDVPLTTAQQEGILIDFPFQIHAGTKSAVILDVNVYRSLRKTGPGQYQFVPSILPALRDQSGCVYGTLAFAGDEKAIRVRAEYLAGDARAPGTQVNDSFAREDGTFRLWALPVGTYRVVAEALDRFENVIGTQTFENVVVAGGEEVEVGAS